MNAAIPTPPPDAGVDDFFDKPAYSYVDPQLRAPNLHHHHHHRRPVTVKCTSTASTCTSIITSSTINSSPSSTTSSSSSSSSVGSPPSLSSSNNTAAISTPDEDDDDDDDDDATSPEEDSTEEEEQMRGRKRERESKSERGMELEDLPGPEFAAKPAYGFVLRPLQELNSGLLTLRREPPPPYSAAATNYDAVGTATFTNVDFTAAAADTGISVLADGGVDRNMDRDSVFSVDELQQTLEEKYKHKHKYEGEGEDVNSRAEMKTSQGSWPSNNNNNNNNPRRGDRAELMRSKQEKEGKKEKKEVQEMEVKEEVKRELETYHRALWKRIDNLFVEKLVRKHYPHDPYSARKIIVEPMLRELRKR